MWVLPLLGPVSDASLSFLPWERDSLEGRASPRSAEAAGTGRADAHGTPMMLLIRGSSPTPPSPAHLSYDLLMPCLFLRVEKLARLLVLFKCFDFSNLGGGERRGAHSAGVITTSGCRTDGRIRWDTVTGRPKSVSMLQSFSCARPANACIFVLRCEASNRIHAQYERVAMMPTLSAARKTTVAMATD